MSNWQEIEQRPDDKKRQDAHKTGVGGSGGEDSDQPEIRQKALPKAES
ncbi:hypothetical protein ES703_24426 [subsurface metagenome]